MKLIKIAAINGLLLCSLQATAQPSVAQVEQELIGHLNRIQYWRFEYSPEDTSFAGEVSPADSLNDANRKLEAYLLQVAESQPALLKANLKIPENADLKIVNSDDKKLRIYCWDTQTGGTMKVYRAVAQYEDNGRVKSMLLDGGANSKEDMNPGQSYLSIYTLNAGKKYYLPVYTAIYSTKDVMKGIRALAVEGGELKPAVIFETNNTTVDKIEYTYDYAANYDFKKMKESYVLHMDKQKLYVPLVEGDKLNGKWQVYIWNGNKFVYDKNAK
ncbi:MAG TPA: hypothetical protein VGD89_01575 [Flavipsychrobacter sp.]